jgi:hypothetical protein
MQFQIGNLRFEMRRRDFVGGAGTDGRVYEKCKEPAGMEESSISNGNLRLEVRKRRFFVGRLYGGLRYGKNASERTGKHSQLCCLLVGAQARLPVLLKGTERSDGGS